MASAGTVRALEAEKRSSQAGLRAQYHAAHRLVAPGNEKPAMVTTAGLNSAKIQVRLRGAGAGSVRQMNPTPMTHSSPKLMPSAFASRTRSLLGSTYLSLPATSASGTRVILRSTWAIM